MKKTIKTIDVHVMSDSEESNIKRWVSEDPESLNRVLQSGYNEGLNDGTLEGYAFAGLALLAAAGICKLVGVIKRK